MLGMPKLPPGIRKRWNGYFGRWYEDGRRHERNFGPSLAVARKCIDEVRRNARLRAAGLGQEIAQVAPLAPLVEAYHAAHAAKWRPKYAREVRVALDEMLEGIGRVADLTAGRVEAARDRLEGSARTRNKKAAWVLSFARWLRRTGQGNPPLLALAPVPRADVRRRRVLTRDEVARLVEHGGRVADLIALLAGTGLRLDEGLRLSWDDVEGGFVRVRKSKLRRRARSARGGGPTPPDAAPPRRASGAGARGPRGVAPPEPDDWPRRVRPGRQGGPAREGRPRFRSRRPATASVSLSPSMASERDKKCPDFPCYIRLSRRIYRRRRDEPGGELRGNAALLETFDDLDDSGVQDGGA